MKDCFWRKSKKYKILNFIIAISFLGTHFFNFKVNSVYAENSEGHTYKVRNFNNEPDVELKIADGRVALPAEPSVIRNKVAGTGIDMQPENMNLPSVVGWIFKGWKIVTPNIRRLNEDYFVMPEQDVDIVGVWGKLGITKSMEAEKVFSIPTLASGKVVNSVISKLSGGIENAEKFEYSSTVINDSNYTKMDSLNYNADGLSLKQEDLDSISSNKIVNISVQESPDGYKSNTESPVYMWYYPTTKTIYYSGLADSIYLGSNCAEMFNECPKLLSIDLSKFDTSKVTDTLRMFKGCSALKTIYVNDKFNLKSVKKSGNMFYECYNIEGEKGSVYDSNNMDKTYARIDGGSFKPGYLTLKS
ncbi:MAG: BspA family leucine-rich repeat surface protein [Clostridia bacterium]|nr:BspA family leucine-rich repeat surface protein [Clostridia bacterium]